MAGEGIADSLLFLLLERCAAGGSGGLGLFGLAFGKVGGIDHLVVLGVRGLFGRAQAFGHVAYERVFLRRGCCRCVESRLYVGLIVTETLLQFVDAGLQPQDIPCAEDGPAAYFATVPVQEMARAIAQAGLPGSVSYTAGTFVCNDLLYTLLHHYHDTAVRVGFIHVPFLPGQAGQGQPSMALDDIVRALCAAIEAL